MSDFHIVPLLTNSLFLILQPPDCDQNRSQLPCCSRRQVYLNTSPVCQDVINLNMSLPIRGGAACLLTVNLSLTFATTR